jgi:hypothetical protein
VVGEGIKVRRAVTVRTGQDAEGLEVYSFDDGRGKWRPGRIRATPYGMEYVLADLDFDGTADLWVTGCDEGQQRLRRSDVWRFDRRRSATPAHAAGVALLISADPRRRPRRTA